MAKAKVRSKTQEATIREAFFEGLKVILAAQKESGGEPPRFRMLPREIACLGSLYDIGPRLCQNDSAREVMGIWLNCARMCGIDGPTYMMLRVFVDELGLDVETCGLADLGLVTMGSGVAGPS